jgi:heme/copper-type cytochrome/quinol oxidase subunit 2
VTEAWTLLRLFWLAVPIALAVLGVAAYFSRRYS